ncbi:MAG: FHA domain-containing protein [Actinomycetota bacterium]
MAEVFCNQCGHRNPAGSNFCSSCGAALEPRRDDRTDRTITFQGIDPADTPEDDVTVNLDELPGDTGTLIVKRGDNAGARFSLEAEVTTAGRHPDSHIFLDDITVSRRHAEIRRASGDFSLHDVGSLNGTYVNKQRVEESDLRSGDEIQIGKFKLVFLTGG